MKLQKILALVFGVLWGVCELLNMIPSVESNSALQLIFSVVKAIYHAIQGNGGV